MKLSSATIWLSLCLICMILGSGNVGEASDSDIIDTTENPSRSIEAFQESEENLLYDAELSATCNFCRILMIILLLIMNPYSILETWEIPSE